MNQALAEEKKKRDLTKTAIGKLLGLGRSAISKKFDGRHNFTLETLADLAFALDRSVKVTLAERPPARVGSNAEIAEPIVPAAVPLASIKTALPDRMLPSQSNIASMGIARPDQSPEQPLDSILASANRAFGRASVFAQPEVMK
ncbi:MAG: helix-turn-helix transcriptional regulator [Enhydrobacter sp.]|nr:MAG: helix-turn-helix transcriptional regulator [Enhydrobacter sp.]